MKKTFLLLIIIASVFSACKKSNDYVFKESPDDRLNAALTSYQSTLTGATNGWKAFLTVRGDTGGTYSFFFKFTNANRVSMFSDFTPASAVTLQESSYRLKAEQQPTLIFDTYSYVHILADPNESTVDIQADINGGEIGQGLLSDFEFAFDDAKVKADTVELAGKANHSKLLLVKATQAEEDAYNSGALAAGIDINKILTYFKRLKIGPELYDIRINTLTRQFIFSWPDASGNPVTFTTGYYFIAGGIAFNTPVVTGTQTISGFNNVTWNQASGVLNITVGSAAATVTSTVLPLKVDLTAPRRWWQYPVDNSGLWTSRNGFHVNGVDDAFGVKSLIDGTSIYFALVYWPRVSSSNDLFAPFFLNATRDSLLTPYANAARFPLFTTDGRAIFQDLIDYPPPDFIPYPTTGAAADSKTLLYDPNGYYFVQTSGVSFDMINASDGKSWISWLFHL